MSSDHAGGPDDQPEDHPDAGSPDQALPPTLARALESASVLVCCGSGGVGKTTTAAVLGIEAARRGRRAVVVTIDPARRLADALGLEDGLGSQPQLIALDAPGELWAMMLDTAATFDGLVRLHASTPEQAERILANRFYRNIAGALSGTQEYMAAETLHDLHLDERFDLVVVDTPPSRHALDFLDAPGVLSRFLEHRLFRLMMLPARRGLSVLNTAAQPILRAVGKVVGSAVLADAVAFFQAFAGMESGFRERAADVIALLRSEETRFVLVASPRVDTVAEAAWFADQLSARGHVVGAAIVNRAHPRFGDGDAAAALAAAAATADAGLAAMWRNLAELRAMAEAEHAVLAPLAERVGTAPLVEVPLLAGDVHDLEALTEIGRHLFEPAPG